MGEGVVRELGVDMYTLLYFKWIANKNSLYSTENSAQCFVTAWMVGSFRENGSMHVMAESLCYSHETVTTLLTGHQFSSVTQSCPTLCDPMNHSTPGLPAHHQLPEFTQTHVHRVGDAI